MSKREILEHVWDSHYDGDPNVVEVYVGYLRRKIDAPFGRRAVETVRGAGYRLAGNGGTRCRSSRGVLRSADGRLHARGRVGLAAAGVLLVAALDRSLLASLDESARQRGADIATLVDADRLADPCPPSALP